MSDKETLLKEAREGYLELQQSIAGLDEARAGEPWLGTWGVREILIHASGWLLEMTPALERIGRGESPYPEGVSYDDFDAWNAQFVEARRGVKLADVVAELEASHRDFVAAARALADEHFAPETAGRGLIENCTSQHYREHAAQIREWRRAAMAS
jgi:Protein of unknown function (DUF1706)